VELYSTSNNSYEELMIFKLINESLMNGKNPSTYLVSLSLSRRHFGADRFATNQPIGDDQLPSSRPFNVVGQYPSSDIDRKLTNQSNGHQTRTPECRCEILY